MLGDVGVNEIADGIYRISTWVPGIGGPAEFTFNQFLVRAEQPICLPISATGRPGGVRHRGAVRIRRGRVPLQLHHAVHRADNTKLAGLEPRTLAVMHGSSFTGDAPSALNRMADSYDQRLAAALETAG
jgi:hypothetical protein